MRETIRIDEEGIFVAAEPLDPPLSQMHQSLTHELTRTLFCRYHAQFLHGDVFPFSYLSGRMVCGISSYATFFLCDIFKARQAPRDRRRQSMGQHTNNNNKYIGNN